MERERKKEKVGEQTRRQPISAATVRIRCAIRSLLFVSCLLTQTRALSLALFLSVELGITDMRWLLLFISVFFSGLLSYLLNSLNNGSLCLTSLTQTKLSTWPNYVFSQVLTWKLKIYSAADNWLTSNSESMLAQFRRLKGRKVARTSLAACGASI